MPEPKKLVKSLKSGGFKVKQSTRKPVGEEVEEKLASEEASLEEEITPEGADEVVSGMLVEASAKMIGKTAELLTKIPEMNFSEDELEQLVKVWTPLMPEVSPIFGAIIVTITIVAGKVVIYRLGSKAIKVETEEEEYEKMGPEKSEE